MIAVVESAPCRAQPAAFTDSLLTVVRTTHSKPQQVLTLIKLSEYFRNSDSTRAYGYAERAVALARQHADTLEARALLALGIVYQFQGHYPVAMTHYQQALKRAQAHRNIREIAQCYRTMSIYYINRSEFTKAWTAAQYELPLRQQMHDTVKLIGLYNNMANIFRGQGDYPAALQAYLRSIKMANGARRATEEAYVSANIGWLYQQLKDYPLALRYLNRAVSMHEEQRDTTNTITDYSSLGEVYTLMKQYSTAQRFLEKSLRLGQAHGSRISALDKARTYAILGRLQAKQGHHTLALRNFQQAEKTFRRIHQHSYLIKLLSSMAETYHALGRPQEAQRAAAQTLELARETKSSADFVDAWCTLAKISAANGDFAAAYAYRVRFEESSDSLFSAQKEQQLLSLQTRYDFREKEAQIALLRKDTALMRSKARLQYWFGGAMSGALLLASLLGISWYRRYQAQRTANRQLQIRDGEIAAKNDALLRTQQRLYQSLSEKEMLLKEVHHRVKNNLQIIASLFALQAYEHPNLPALTEMLQEGQNRIQTIALIHELLYQSADLARIDFHQFLQQLTAYLSNAFGRPMRMRTRPVGVFSMPYAQDAEPPTAVLINTQATGVYLNASTAVPLGLILNELLSNAYNHAFPDGRNGQVDLHISAPDSSGTFTATISDNGVGLPRNFKLENTSSLGLRLVNNLTRQLKGTFQAQNSASGARFIITFQEAKEGLEAQ
ncbi:tetratricopeptide repeat protein [Hymenobacter terrenus]|uniref:tetratricopeptide repeat protein n=1 Tax=Hymenobacter terrenus TaxID=1629124 RepID=UPI0006968006|nr:tetratricopeptide repeat protein [Hymenobacter terrenus]